MIDKFGDTQLGVQKVQEIHLSNREFIDTFDLQRIARYDVSGEYNDDKGYFACDYKLMIGDDNDDFGY